MDEILLKKANAYVLRLFKLRPRSCFEISMKLSTKGYDVDIANYLVEKYKRMGLLNDHAFAKMWMNGRLKKYGMYRVEQELKQKGITQDCIEEIKKSFLNEYDEDVVMKEIVEKRLKMYQRVDQSLQRLKLKKRMVDYLIRRGFKVENVMKVVKKI